MKWLLIILLLSCKSRDTSVADYIVKMKEDNIELKHKLDSIEFHGKLDATRRRYELKK